jgi:hypothetical protein
VEINFKYIRVFETSSCAVYMATLTVEECGGSQVSSWLWLIDFFFLYIFIGFCVYVYLCRPSEASTRYCVIPGGYPPQDWQSLPCGWLITIYWWYTGLQSRVWIRCWQLVSCSRKEQVGKTLTSEKPDSNLSHHHKKILVYIIVSEEILLFGILCECVFLDFSPKLL